MPAIEIATHERRNCEDLVRHIKYQYDQLTPAGRQVFAIMFGRELGEELRQAIAALRQGDSNRP